MPSPKDISRGYDTSGTAGLGNPGDAVKATGATFKYKNKQADNAMKTAVTNTATAVANAATRAATPNAGMAIRRDTTGTASVPVAAVETASFATLETANYTAAQEAANLTQSMIDDPQNTHVIDVGDTGTNPSNSAKLQ